MLRCRPLPMVLGRAGARPFKYSCMSAYESPPPVERRCPVQIAERESQGLTTRLVLRSRPILWSAAQCQSLIRDITDQSRVDRPRRAQGRGWDLNCTTMADGECIVSDITADHRDRRVRAAAVVSRLSAARCLVGWPPLSSHVTRRSPTFGSTLGTPRIGKAYPATRDLRFGKR